MNPKLFTWKTAMELTAPFSPALKFKSGIINQILASKYVRYKIKKGNFYVRQVSDGHTELFIQKRNSSAVLRLTYTPRLDGCLTVNTFLAANYLEAHYVINRKFV